MTHLTHKTHSLMKSQTLLVALAAFAGRTALAQSQDPLELSESDLHVADTVEAFTAVGLRQSPENKTIFVCPASFTDRDLERIPNAPFEFGLHISGSGVTNDGVRKVSQLPNRIAALNRCTI